ncbi:MAG: pyruvate kinase [bacterium]|nr:pyruvate kinase [bacterium]
MNDKRTKIVCTLGPASETLPKITQLIRAGMNVARLNFSHGTYAHHRMLIRNTRAAARKLGVQVALLADLQGPKVRVGLLPKDGVVLKAGEQAIFRAGAETMHDEKIPVPYRGLAADVSKGDRILLDDGLIEVEVIRVRGTDIFTEVKVGGTLTSHKGFNVPTATLHIPNVTKKDLQDLKFAIEQNVDFVALSFVRTADDIRAVRRRLMQNARSKSVKLIAKIEKHEAVKYFDDILHVVDGIMVARGDLAVETAAENVPVLQRRMIEACLVAAKPVIVATQMLDSMIRNPRPTRAEVSDVAHAVIEHADGVMLSGETATGKYPIPAVKMMASVIRETEISPYDDLRLTEIREKCRSQEEMLGEAAVRAACDPQIKGIVVTTETGRTARFIARFRPEAPLIALCPDSRVSRQLSLTWGVIPVPVRPMKSLTTVLLNARRAARETGIAKRGEKIALVTGIRVGKPGFTNILEIVIV